MALLGGAMVAVQGGNVLAIELAERVGTVGAASARVVFGAAGLALVTRPAVRGRSRADWLVLIRLGVVLAGATLTFLESTTRLPLGVAVTIGFLGPLTVSVAAARRRTDLIWPVLALIGVGLLVRETGDGEASAAGYAFAAANAACWGGYIVLAARAGRRFPGRVGLALGLGVAAAIDLPLGVAAAGSALLDPIALLIGAATGVVTITLAFSFEYEALRRLSARVFGTVVSLEPAVGALMGFALLGQRLTPGQLAGMAIVATACGGVALTVRRARPADGPPPLVN